MNSEIIQIEDETLWEAVLERDTRYDGIVFYAVRSTGIYCKPSCPSRRPKRETVVFFQSPEEAEKSGFRACKRCRPREALSPDSRAALIQHACELIDARSGETLSLRQLSRDLNVSPSHLSRLFKAGTGLTPAQYAAGKRLQNFKQQVKNGRSVTAALYEAGYSSSSRLYEKSAKTLGMTPASYRRGGRGMEIRYTIADTRLGHMLVAATAQGICAVSFGSDDARLEAFLHAEYPEARMRRDNETLGAWVNALVRHLEGEQPALGLPLDVSATTFQLKVWEELRKIPYGETRSYADVARAIGQPKAVRAVARACATNPAAVVTPCHRVVRSDGALGGYRWGLDRKQALLEQEKRHR